jgi:hypothetical protein
MFGWNLYLYTPPNRRDDMTKVFVVDFSSHRSRYQEMKPTEPIQADDGANEDEQELTQLRDGSESA